MLDLNNLRAHLTAIDPNFEVSDKLVVSFGTYQLGTIFIDNKGFIGFSDDKNADPIESVVLQSDSPEKFVDDLSKELRLWRSIIKQKILQKMRESLSRIDHFVCFGDDFSIIYNGRAMGRIFMSGGRLTCNWNSDLQQKGIVPISHDLFSSTWAFDDNLEHFAGRVSEKIQQILSGNPEPTVVRKGKLVGELQKRLKEISSDLEIDQNRIVHNGAVQFGKIYYDESIISFNWIMKTERARIQIPRSIDDAEHIFTEIFLHHFREICRTEATASPLDQIRKIFSGWKSIIANNIVILTYRNKRLVLRIDKTIDILEYPISVSPEILEHMKHAIENEV